jgi:uncharacterized surface protein with fasciclin (FAS1) repeats
MMRTPHESSSNFKGDNVNKKIAVLLLSIMAIAATTALAGSKNPMVGGQEMYPTKDIIDNAVNSADHTTLVAAVKAAGLVDTLKGPGPFTVFAPTRKQRYADESTHVSRRGRAAQRFGSQERNPSRTRASHA